MDQDNEVSSRQPMQAVQEEFQTLQYENTQNNIRPGDKEEWIKQVGPSLLEGVQGIEGMFSFLYFL